MIISTAVWILAWPIITTLEKVKEIPTSHILIILDISRSMLATDIEPDRITAAKYTIHTFLTKRNHEKVWLILFAGKPFLSIPFTDDYAWIESILSHISPYTIRQELPWLSGTAIGDALLLWIWAFSWHLSENKNILLFTDGRVNIWIDPRKIIPDITKENIHVYTIGIGTLSGWTIPGNGVAESSGWTTLDEELLQEIANKTWGKYSHATESKELSTSAQDVDTLIEQKVQEKIIEKRTDYRLNLTIILFFLVFIEYLLRRYIRKYYNLL
jgi:Ca-activated chloride channel family protein